MVCELASLEKEEEKMTIFEKIFLGFYKAELKSEGICICTQEGQGFQLFCLL